MIAGIPGSLADLMNRCGAKVCRDREHTGDWRAEKLREDDEAIEIAIFGGGDARQPAIRYADREYGEL